MHASEDVRGWCEKCFLRGCVLPSLELADCRESQSANAAVIECVFSREDSLVQRPTRAHTISVAEDFVKMATESDTSEEKTAIQFRMQKPVPKSRPKASKVAL